MTRKLYTTDLTDEPSGHLEPLLPKPTSGTRRGGRPATSAGMRTFDVSPLAIDVSTCFWL